MSIDMPIEADPQHTHVLDQARNHRERVAYACEQQLPGDVRTVIVQQWLQRHGWSIPRPTVSTALNEWRREREMDDTGEQQALTDATLAEMDSAMRMPDSEQTLSDDDGASPDSEPDSVTPASAAVPAPEASDTPVSDTPDTSTPEPVTEPQRGIVAVWPVWLLMLPATVAIWTGWVGLGEMAGFGPVRPLPGIADNFVINSAITLPIGMEVYAAYALYVWLSGLARGRAKTLARRSAITALIVGALGQVAYHVMSAAHVSTAPWWITAGVACLPVAVVGLGAGLAHTVRAERETSNTE